MPALAVNKDEVRMLVMALGVREAARKLELNENTVLTWSRDGKWLAHLKEKPLVPSFPLSMQRAISTISPVDAMAATLSDRHKRTKLGLSKWAAKSSEHLASLDGEEALAASQPAVAVATVMGKVWPEKAEGPMRLSVFAHGGNVQVDVTHDLTDDECHVIQETHDDPLDDPMF